MDSSKPNSLLSRAHSSVEQRTQDPTFSSSSTLASVSPKSASRATSLDHFSLNVGERTSLLPFADRNGSPARPTVFPSELDNEETMETKSTLYLVLLTISIGGLQMAWAVELSNGSPYLLSLGLTKSLMALVWIAGPITGVIVQPYVGIRSDNCRVPWGKRKPFMIGGCVATVVSLLALAWAKELVRAFLGIFGVDPAAEGVRTVTQIFAVIAIYSLDCAVNTVQAGIRAFIVDNAPTHQQDTANAWAARINSAGNIVGYLFGYVNLPTVLPFFGNTQFKVLSVIACLSLSGTLAISCSYIKERDPRLDKPPSVAQAGFGAFTKRLLISIPRLPPQIRQVCIVQFFSWMGWFPFMYYITTYIGQLYVNPYLRANPSLTDTELSLLWERATRIGTFALLMFAITCCISSILLPFLVAPSYTSRHPPAMPPLAIRPLTLRRAWFLSHILLATCLLATIFITTPTSATVLVAVIGVPWSLTQWAPLALIGAEVSKRSDDRHRRDAAQLLPSPVSSTASTGSGPHEEDQAGVVLGLHNVAVSAPQIVATLLSSAIFRALQKPRGVPGDESVGWTLRAGAIATVVAAWMTLKVREGWEEEKVDGNGDEADGLIREG